MIKKLLGLVLFLVLAAGAILLFAVYRSGESSAPGVSSDAAGEGAVAAARDRVMSAVSAAGGSEVRLTEKDLQSLLVTALANHPNGRRILELSKGLNASIEEGRVEVGVTINLAEIPRDSLSEKEREVITRIENTIPLLADRDIYLGLDGVPSARDGAITFDKESRIHLAFLRLPLETVVEQFGLDEKFRDQLTFELPYFRVQAARVDGDTLVLSISAEG